MNGNEDDPLFANLLTFFLFKYSYINFKKDLLNSN